MRESTMEDLRSVIKQPISVVLYHYPCPDGVFAALAAYLYHTAVARPVSFLPNTVYEPLRSGPSRPPSCELLRRNKKDLMQ